MYRLEINVHSAAFHAEIFLPIDGISICTISILTCEKVDIIVGRMDELLVVFSEINSR